MRKKERIVHDYELGRPWPAPDPEAKWWEPEMTTPSRAARHAKEPRKTRVPLSKIVMILLLIALILGAFLLLINDLRGGSTGGDKNATMVVTETTVLLDPKLVSPDTVKLRLEKAGFQVEPLVDSYDRTQHGYDVADTIINRNKAQILSFPDKAVTRDFVNVGAGTGYVLVYGDVWAISFGQGEDAKPLAEDVAAKLGAKFYWTPSE